MKTNNHSEILSLYNNTRQKIGYHKSVPWRFNIAHFIVTAFLIYLGCKDYHPSYFLFAFLIYTLFTLFVFYIPFYSYSKIKKSREVLDRIYKYFSSDFNKIKGGDQVAGLNYGDKIFLCASIIFPILIFWFFIFYFLVKLTSNF